jgi:hypothetical protein
MKIICLFIAVLFTSFQSKGQENNQLNEMINSSINSYIAWNNDFVKGGISVRDTCHYYICIDGLPANFPVENIKNITFFSLYNVSGFSKLFQKELKKGINAYFVSIKLIEKQFVITVSGRDVKLIKKNQIGISIGDWGIFTYKYFCKEQKWLLARTEYSGI